MDVGTCSGHRDGFLRKGWSESTLRGRVGNSLEGVCGRAEGQRRCGKVDVCGEVGLQAQALKVEDAGGEAHHGVQGDPRARQGLASMPDSQAGPGAAPAAPRVPEGLSREEEMSQIQPCLRDSGAGNGSLTDRKPALMEGGAGHGASREHRTPATERLVRQTVSSDLAGEGVSGV